MRLLAWLSATSAVQPVSDVPSMIPRACKVSCISHIVVALEFAIPVRQSEDHEQKQRDDPPVACRRECAILHPSTRTHLTNTSWEGIRLRSSFFLFVLLGLYCNAALLLLRFQATIFTTAVSGCMVWRQRRIYSLTMMQSPIGTRSRLQRTHMLPAVLGANLVACAGMREGTPTVLTLRKTLQSPELAPGKEGQP